MGQETRHCIWNFSFFFKLGYRNISNKVITEICVKLFVFLSLMTKTSAFVEGDLAIFGNVLNSDTDWKAKGFIS